MKARGFIAGALISVSAALISCSGGGSSSITPSTALQGTYSGVALVGDYGSYTVSGNSVSYRITGAVYGDMTGNMVIVPAYVTDSNTHYWKTTDGQTMMFLSESMGMMHSKNIGGGVTMVCMKEKNPLDVTQVAGKTYNYFKVSGGSMDLCSVTINTDNTFDYSCISGVTGNGCWLPDTEHPRLKGLDTTGQTYDCATWDGLSPDYYFRIMQPDSGRMGIMIDFTDGTGYGMGMEQRSYDFNTDVGTRVKFETMGVDGSGNMYSGSMDMTYDSGTGDCTFEMTVGNTSMSGTVESDCFFDASGIKQTGTTGVACALDADGNMYNIMMDKSSGMYMAIKNDGSYVEIGAIK
ncbi:hypothetical protein [Persephonella sp.]